MTAVRALTLLALIAFVCLLVSIDAGTDPTRPTPVRPWTRGCHSEEHCRHLAEQQQQRLTPVRPWTRGCESQEHCRHASVQSADGAEQPIDSDDSLFSQTIVATPAEDHAIESSVDGAFSRKELN